MSNKSIRLSALTAPFATPCPSGFTVPPALEPILAPVALYAPRNAYGRWCAALAALLKARNELEPEDAEEIIRTIASPLVARAPGLDIWGRTTALITVCVASHALSQVWPAGLAQALDVPTAANQLELLADVVTELYSHACSDRASSAASLAFLEIAQAAALHPGLLELLRSGSNERHANVAAYLYAVGVLDAGHDKAPRKQDRLQRFVASWRSPDRAKAVNAPFMPVSFAGRLRLKFSGNRNRWRWRGAWRLVASVCAALTFVAGFALVWIGRREVARYTEEHIEPLLAQWQTEREEGAR
ncbi:MAG: hypothetical protein GY711_15080 [bacterium]|nr:hypothetical protein [bacterium]